MQYQIDESMPANRFSVHYDDGRIEPTEKFADLVATIEPREGEIVWLLTVGYETGDSFGRDPDIRHEHVDIYPTREAAEAVARAIRKHHERTKGWPRQQVSFEDEHRMPITFGNGDTRTIHLPWAGYFERLEFIEVQEVAVGTTSRRRF